MKAEALQYFTLYDLSQHTCLPLCCCNDKVAKCRLKPYPTLYETFMIKDGSSWRPPAVNESCCARPQLAATLQRIAQHGPHAVYTGQAGQVIHGLNCLCYASCCYLMSCHSTSRYVMSWCITLQEIALSYITSLHYSTTCHRMIPRIMFSQHITICFTLFRYIVLHCTLLHQVATHYITKSMTETDRLSASEPMPLICSASILIFTILYNLTADIVMTLMHLIW